MISVVIPTLNEALHIRNIVTFCLKSSLVTEVIVIDDGSTDETQAEARAAGAKVFLSSMLGKGTSMLDGLWKAQEDVILYLDGDIYNFSENLIPKMVGPILEDQCDLVKGKFKRSAGRVTELTAKPLLRVFFPELSYIRQPLGGIVAGRKEFLKNLEFDCDFGVDIGLLIDAFQLGARMVEVDIGYLDHDHQPLDRLSNMSNQVTRAILERASRYKKLHVHQVKDSYEKQRVFELDQQKILRCIDVDKKLALFDMDGTLVAGRYVERLARFVNRYDELQKYLDNSELDAEQRTAMIARVFSGLPKSVFEKVAATIPLVKGAQELVVDLKKRGYNVGILTDSYFIASEIIRKRVFADFSVANLLTFRRGLCVGDVKISPLFFADLCDKHPYCKKNFLSHFERRVSSERQRVYFAGDGLNDICLMEELSNSCAVNPKHESVSNAAAKVVNDLSQLMGKWC